MIIDNKTILSVSLFQTYTVNYYYANPYKQLSATTLGNLPQRILVVETSLNSQLNGRLYQKYNPNNLQFHGTDKLTPEQEERTLYVCLTLCVQYNLETGVYVNLNNSYSGNVNGNNNFSANNSNVIGWRNDIRDMLTQLGLYKNIYIGNVKPEGALFSNINPYINMGNLQSLVNFIENYDWTFKETFTIMNPSKLMVGTEQFSTWVQQYVNFPYEKILLNYITNNQAIPYLTSNNVNYWNESMSNLNNILSNYTTTSSILPLITNDDVNRWNSLVTEENLGQLNQAVSQLQDKVQTNTSNIASNQQNITTNTNDISALQTEVNTHFQDTQNVMKILSNYENSSGSGAYTIVPLISGGDIDQIFTNKTNIANLQSSNTTLSNQYNTMSNLLNNVISNTNNYNKVLANYLPTTPIPLITQSQLDNIVDYSNLVGQVKTNTNNIATMQSDIENLKDISINASYVKQIETNTANIATNTKDITNIQNTINSSLSKLQYNLTNYNSSQSLGAGMDQAWVNNVNSSMQQISTNTNNILSNTQQINLNTSNLTNVSSNVGTLQFILNNYVNNGAAEPNILPLITTSTVSQIYQNRENISQNSSAIQQNQQTISMNAAAITNLQNAYTEQPTADEWDWLINNNSYQSTSQWITLTNASGQTIYRLEFRFSLRNNTTDRFNMSNTGYIAENYTSTGCEWNIQSILGGWYFGGDPYNLGLPNGVSPTKAIALLHKGKAYVNAGKNANYSAAYVELMNMNGRSIYDDGSGILVPSSMLLSNIVNVGWSEGVDVCINTLLYLDFIIE